MKRLGIAAIAALLAIPAVASAAVIAPTDMTVWFTTTGLDPVNDIVAASISDDFDTALDPPPAMGTLTSTVYFDADSSLYTYVHLVNPTIDNISEFNTEFAVENLVTAGWRFTGTNSAQAAGMSAMPSAFVISQESDLGIDWEGVFLPGESLWDSGEAIFFFFVTPQAPGAGDYNLINSEVGTASTYAPVPEPGSMSLIAAGLLGLAGAVRRRRARARLS